MDYDKDILEICERIIAVYAVKGDMRPLQLKLRDLLEKKEAKDKQDGKQG